MSGIWDRIIPGEDRVNAHLLKASLHLAVYGVFTDAQVLNGLNSRVTMPLDSAAEADLVAIKDALVALGTAGSAARLIGLERFDAMNIAAEVGVLTSEATYRAQLGIS